MSFDERYTDLQRGEINQHLEGLHRSVPEPRFSASMSEDADRQPGLAQRSIVKELLVVLETILTTNC